MRRHQRKTQINKWKYFANTWPAKQELICISNVSGLLGMRWLHLMTLSSLADGGFPGIAVC